MSAAWEDEVEVEKKWKEKKSPPYLRVRVEDVEVDPGQVGREHPVDGVAAPAADADDLFWKGAKKVEKVERERKRGAERRRVEGERGAPERAKKKNRRCRTWFFEKREREQRSPAKRKQREKRIAFLVPSVLHSCVISLARWIRNVDIHRRSRRKRAQRQRSASKTAASTCKKQDKHDDDAN